MSELDIGAILQDRENRWQRKQELVKLYALPLVSLNINWPGGEKNHPLALHLFQMGEKAWNRLVLKEKLTQVHRESQLGPMGPGALYVLAEDPRRLKLLATHLEDHHPLGRLWDFDVVCKDGQQLSRQDLGSPPRQCLLCGQPANLCRHLGRHSVDELVQRIEHLVQVSRGWVNN